MTSAAIIPNRPVEPPAVVDPPQSSSPSEYVAVILAGSIGTRLYPVTTDGDGGDYSSIPKHMLPIGGIPILLRLLRSIELCGFVECVLLLKEDDTTTMDLFLKSSTTPQYSHPYQLVQPKPPPRTTPSSSTTGSSSSSSRTKPATTASITNTGARETNEFASSAAAATTICKVTLVQSTQMKVTILQYATPCSGTVDALRRISQTNSNSTNTGTSNSHMVVFPSDLIVLDTKPILNMIHEHRCHEYNTTNNSNSRYCSAPLSHAPARPPPPGQSLTALPQLSTRTDATANATTSTANATTTTNHNYETNAVPIPVLSSPPHVAATVLLMNVTAIDDSTLQPIYKESAKQKKGLLSREDDDVFYMAIQSTKSSSSSSSSSSRKMSAGSDTTTTNRLIWKQSKLDVEEDKEQIGTTPKVKLPKFRLYGGTTTTNNSWTTTQISTEWNDVHCYCLSSWVVQQLSISEKLQQSLRYQSVQYDLLPLLISRQYRGIRATFHSSNKDNTGTSNMAVDTDQRTTKNMNEIQSPHLSSRTNHDDHEYRVLAHVSNSRTIASGTPSIFRSHTIASYLFANRIMAHEMSAMNVVSLQQQQHSSSSSSSAGTTITNPLLQVPHGAAIQSKFHTILLPECHVGEKVTFKSCVIGRHCTIGNNCRLNNVVLHDHVMIGDNTTLQSTIVGAHVTIGTFCNFNDCQILHHMNIPPNTKKKGEAMTSSDD